MTSTARKLLRHGWSVLSWIVLSGLVAGGVAGLIFYQRADEELRRLIQKQLADAYPHLDLRLGAARLLPSEGIRLDQIVLVDRNTPNGERRSELVYVDRLTVQCDASLPALLQGDLKVQAVKIEGLVIYGERQADGSWNLADLAPRKLPPCRGQQLPRISIQGGELKLRDARDEASRSFQAESLDLEITLKRLAPVTPDGQLPEILAAFEGSCRTTFCRHVHWQGVARTTDGAWTIRGELGDVQWSADVSRQLPQMVAEWLRPLDPLRGRATLHYELRSASRQAALEYRVSGQFAEGTWHDARLPLAVTEIACLFALDRERLEVRNLEAMFGESRFRSSLTLQGHRIDAPFDFQLEVDRFPLSRRVAELLPQHLLETWEKFQAAGLVSGTIHVESDGTGRRVDADLRCEQLALQHHKFPYPLSECHGTMNLRGDQLHFELDGLAGGTPIELDGTIHHPGPHFTGWWELKSTRWKAVDESLIAALPKKASDFVRQLQLRGNVGFWVRQDRRDPKERPPLHVVVSVNQGWINYAQFPYAISNIRGDLELKDGRWEFRDLEGWNDGCRISCAGYWDMQAEDAPLELDFTADQVNLDAELKQALRPASQRIWEQLRPQGSLDHLEVTVFKTQSMPQPDLDIRVAHLPEPDREFRGEGLQLHPRWFPLRFTQAYGEARSHDGVLVLKNFSAKHGKSAFQTNATVQMGPQGTWQVTLTELAAERVELTEAVLGALPQKLRETCQRMQVAGMFGLSGAMRFAVDEPDAPLATTWDLTLDIDQGRLKAAWPVENIFGEISLRGGSRAAQFWSQGDMKIDSLMSQQVQLTQIAGPYSLDATRLRFGTIVPSQRTDVPSPPVVAAAYGGQLRSSAEIWLNEEVPFNVQLQLADARLSNLARDWQLGQGNLAGNILLDLFLSGSARGRHTLRGNGTAQLRDATLYELPLILALINRLSSGRRDNAAFHSSDIAFHIRDGYVYFTRFDLSGDAMTLKGFGDMSLNREIRLDFYSMMGREQLWSPLVQPFLRETSRQFLQIHVDGTLSNPRTTQEVLPGLNETLQQLFPEQAAPTPTPVSAPTREASRSRFALPRLAR
jgi:hypothetical protein